MIKIPRKLKKKIPKGVYCYKLTGKTSEVWNEEYKTFVTSYHTDVCPFYAHIKFKDKPTHLQDEIDLEYPDEYGGWCKLIKYELDDQCKSCGINKYDKNGNIL
jgi:hypothetical protein